MFGYRSVKTWICSLIKNFFSEKNMYFFNNYKNVTLVFVNINVCKWF